SALVVAGLDNMARRGITEAMLFVDAENRAAVEMYERLGFRVTRTDRAFVGDITPKSRNDSAHVAESRANRATNQP
ncbi:MAG: hypothetical protein RLZ37_1963, partial [Actinomycetota bacterium]